ncbi:MAG: hypothetical protein U0R24_12620 [Solirubrobacterales bacterium]
MKLARARNLTVLLVASAVVVATPAAASGAERVTDGSFDGATCTPSDCTSTSWTETSTGTSFSPAGPICGPATTNCSVNGGAAKSAPNWARLASTLYSGSTSTSSVAQTVTIPAAPATLTFNLLIQPEPFYTGTFQVTVDGAIVYSATYATTGHATYQPVSVNLDAYAGDGPRTLRFAAVSTYNGPGSGQSGDFQVDDVSLLAADAATPPLVPTPTPTCEGKDATVTGTDAAELLRGTPGNDVIYAGGGGDVVRAGGGKDIVCGGAGKDDLRGQAGNDRLLGQGDADKLKGGKGRDACVGGPGKDVGRGCETGPDA